MRDVDLMIDEALSAEERELLAVQALLATDQRAAAERRARRFERVHPSSVHAHRMHVLLERTKN